MQKKFALSVILLLAFILPGCVFSLYPLYTPADLVYNNKLEGVWSEPGSSDIWKFENLMQHEMAPYKGKPEWEKEEAVKKEFINKNTYLLTYTENGETRKMQANLARLGNNLFLDIFPEELKLKNSFFESQYVPVHTYAKVKQTGDGFELDFFDTEFLNKLLDQNTIRIKHESFKDYKIITASTDELQKFVTKYADKPELFARPVALTKKLK